MAKAFDLSPVHVGQGDNNLEYIGITLSYAQGRHER